jgi:hypothetical protein
MLAQLWGHAAAALGVLVHDGHTCKRGGLPLPAPRPHEPQAPSRAYAAARIPPLAFCGVCGGPHNRLSSPRSHPSRPLVAPRQLQQRQLTPLRGALLLEKSAPRRPLEHARCLRWR